MTAGLLLRTSARLASARSRPTSLFPAAPVTAASVAVLRCSAGPTRYASSAPNSSGTPATAAKSSASSGPSGARTSPRVQTTFVVLSSLGILATAYGVYEYSQKFKTWPRELRDDLRTALLARDRGDSKAAKAGLERVLVAARALVPSGKLGTRNTMLKTSGIAIALGAVLEREGDFVGAYAVYADALDEILLRGNYDPELVAALAAGSADGNEAADGSATAGTAVPQRAARASYVEVRSPEERMRAVALAQRLGDLALRPEVRDHLVNAGELERDPAEKHLSWSVEELLRLVVPRDGAKSAAAVPQAKTAGGADEDGIRLAELELPPWVSTTDLGASLEALGAFYAARGKVEYAVPLFLQAISLLLPPGRSPSAGATAEQSLGSRLGRQAERAAPTVAERCHAGVLMNNLAQLFVQVSESSPLRQPSGASSPSASTGAGAGASVAPLEQGLAWAARGLDVVQTAQASCGWVSSAEAGTGLALRSTGDEAQDLVRAECARAQVTLLYNLGSISEMAKDVPAARRYFQRAYAEADRYGFRDARSRSAAGLARLERKR